MWPPTAIPRPATSSSGTGAVTSRTAPAGWQGIGGTSGAAPLWAALLALTDGSRACSGAPVGFARPGAVPGGRHGVCRGLQRHHHRQQRLHRHQWRPLAAGPGYDPATGLGTPDAAGLAGALCANTIKIARPADRRTTIHASVSLRLHATASSGVPLIYAASGLPPGLKVNAATGLITGRPTRAGRFTVRASAHDSQSQTAGTAFSWTVGGEPTISRLSLKQTAGQPRLAFTVSAGRDAPDLRTLAITVPHALVVGTGRGIGVTSTARRPAHLRFSAHATRGTVLTITLRKTTRSVTDHARRPEPERAGREGPGRNAAPPPGRDGERRGRGRPAGPA